MANDPTTWFNWNLPNDGGDRNTWGVILRDLWSGLDDMFGGKVMPNNKWLTISGATDRSLVINTEFEDDNRASILFTDAADGVNSYEESQFEFRYFGSDANEFRFQSRNGNSLNRTHWRATGDLFRFENRVDIALDRNAAICLSTESNPANRADIVFTDTTPTEDILPTERRFALEYNSATQSLQLNVFDASGDFVATAFTVDSTGLFSFGTGTNLEVDGDIILSGAGSAIRNSTNSLNISANSSQVRASSVFADFARIRDVEYNDLEQTDPWPY